MRAVRWLVTLLIGAITIAALALPGPVGDTVASVSEAQLAALDAASPAASFVTERRDTAWFASRLLHRAIIDPAALGQIPAGLVTGDLFADQPAVSIDTTVHHGPLALGALAFGWEALWPAWSRSRSTLAIDGGQERFALPVTIDTTIGLTGRHQSRLRTTPFDTGWKLDGVRLAATATDVTVVTDRRGQFERLSASGAGLAAAQADREFEAATVTISSHHSGTIVTTLAAENVALRDADTAYRFPAVSGEVELTGDAVALNLDVAQDIPTATTTRADIALTGIDAATRQRWLSTYLATGTLDLAEALAELAAAGGTLTIATLEGTVDGHAYALAGTLRFNAAADSVVAIFAAASGTAELTLAPELVRQLARSQQSVSWLSYLARDGDRYRMSATLGDGVLDLNGAEFPLQPNR